MMIRKFLLFLTAAVFSAAEVLTACGETAADTTPLTGTDGRPVVYAWEDDAPSLYQAYADYFKVGAAINSWDIADPSSETCKILDRQFNIFVPENQAKADTVHPQENLYDFSALDQLMDWAAAAGKDLRGHTLVWHQQCPEWFFKDGDGEAGADLLMERLRSHVSTVVSHCRGKVRTWDVVNEVLDDSNGLRNSDWLRIIGDLDGDGDEYDYIEAAFRAAREADPDARLIINDYSMESSTAKARQMYSLVKALLEEGVPVDGIGMQMHINYKLDPGLLRRNLEILSQLRETDPDLVIEITEMDMSCFLKNSRAAETELTEGLIGKFDTEYAEVFRVLMEFAEKGIIDTVVFWGYYDGASWLNNYPVANRTDYPLLIGRDLKFKSAYWAVYNLPAGR